MIALSRAAATRLAERLGLGLTDAVLSSPTRRREALPAWLTHAFVATDAARAKLDAWIDSGQSPAPTPADALVAQQHFGDELLAHSVARTIAALPAPLSRYALDRATIISVGGSIHGFCAPQLPRDRPWVIVLGADGRGADFFQALVVHEFCHSWLDEEPSAGTTCRTSFAHDTIMHATTFPADLAETLMQTRRQYAVSEQQCRNLVRALNGRDPHDFE